MSSESELFLFGIEYAPPKFGKTSAAVMAFPTATVIGELDAVLPLEGDLGWRMKDVRPAKTIPEATEILRKLGKEKKQRFCFVDDFSLLTDNTVNVLEKTNSDVRALYGKLADNIIDFRNVAAAEQIHVWMNAHVKQPETKDGIFFVGGPKLPGKNAHAIAAKVQTIVKTEVDKSQKGMWPMVYRCSPHDTQYISGDRWGMVFDMAPQNIGELMRSRGFQVPRAPGLEWQEEVVEAFVEAIMAVEEKLQPKAMVETKKEYVEMLEGAGYDPRHIYWAIRDAIDRTRIKRYKAIKHRKMLGM